jgi:hypothetical protein
MIRAARLQVDLYEEVEADPSATGQAMTVVVLSSLAAGIGVAKMAGFTALAVGVLAALVGWFVWAWLTYVIGTRLLPGPQTEADLGQLLRTIGFSASPGVLRILGPVPGVGPIIVFAAGVWMLVAMVIAVRQALDYESTGRAVAVCFVGWLVQFVLMMIPMMLLMRAGGLEEMP